jgi:hypothetical protein
MNDIDYNGAMNLMSVIYLIVLAYFFIKWGIGR